MFEANAVNLFYAALIAIHCLMANEKHWTVDRRLPNHSCYVKHMSFSRDGRMLATSDTEQPPNPVTVRVFGTVTGNQVLEIDEDVGKLVVFSPDGKWLVTKNFVGVECRNASTLERSQSLHCGGATALAFSKDSSRLAVAVNYTTSMAVWVYDTESWLGKRVLEWKADDRGPVSSLAFTSDANHLAVGGVGYAVLSDLKSARSQDLPHGHRVRSIGISSDDLQIMIVASDRIVVWDRTLKSERTFWPKPAEEIRCAVMIPEQGQILAGVVSNLIELDLGSLETPRVLVRGTSQSHVVALAVSADEQQFASALFDGKVEIWSLK